MTNNQAIKAAKKKYKAENGVNAYDASISISERYSGGKIVLIIAGPRNNRQTTEYYF